MPFLASENILIDPAHGTVILPSNEDDKEDDVAGDHDDEDFDWDYCSAVMPSVCQTIMAALPIAEWEFLDLFHVITTTKKIPTPKVTFHSNSPSIWDGIPNKCHDQLH